MKTRIHSLFFAVVLSVAILAGPYRVQATLGESADSITADIEVLSAEPGLIMAHNSYTVHEIDSDSTTVREYISPGGIVFAVAWKGLVHPELTQLLGAYAGEYEAALQETPREPGHSRLRVKTNRVVVEKWGHMRNLQGRAYVPALIPSGVSIDEIK